MNFLCTPNKYTTSRAEQSTYESLAFFFQISILPWKGMFSFTFPTAARSHLALHFHGHIWKLLVAPKCHRSDGKVHRRLGWEEAARMTFFHEAIRQPLVVGKSHFLDFDLIFLANAFHRRLSWRNWRIMVNNYVWYFTSFKPDFTVSTRIFSFSSFTLFSDVESKKKFSSRQFTFYVPLRLRSSCYFQIATRVTSAGTRKNGKSVCVEIINY